MNYKECSHCGHFTDEDEKKCPHCGQNPFKETVMTFLALISLIKKERLLSLKSGLKIQKNSTKPRKVLLPKENLFILLFLLSFGKSQGSFERGLKESFCQVRFYFSSVRK